MSAISSTQSSIPGLNQAALADSIAPAVQTTAAAQSYTPLWLVNTGGGGNALAALGIRMPNANGDLAAMLAQASFSLEQSVDKAEQNKTLSSFATLAGALARFGLEALGRNVDNKNAIIVETTAARKQLGDNTDAAVSESNRQAAAIGAADTKIANLETALKNDKLSPEEREALQNQIGEARSERSAAFAAREAADITIAEARIGNLELQVGDLEKQVSRETAGSDDAKALSTLLSAKKQDLADARKLLSDFKAGSRSDTARNEFSSATKTGLENDKSDLDTRIWTIQAALVLAMAALRNASAVVAATSALANAEFKNNQTSRANDVASRDSGIERLFEVIEENLDAAPGLSFEESENLARRQGVAEEDLVTRSSLLQDDAARRAQSTALALLSAIADIVQTLDAQSTSPQAPMPVPREMMAGRLRVGV